MNKISMIKEMTGLKSGETFKLRIPSGEIAYVHFWFVNDESLSCNIRWVDCNYVLTKILDGTFQIVRISQKPKDGDIVYSAFKTPYEDKPKITKFIFDSKDPVCLILWEMRLLYDSKELASDRYEIDMQAYYGPLVKLYQDK